MRKKDKILVCDLDYTLVTCDSNRVIADLYGLPETRASIYKFFFRLISYDHKMAKVNFSLYWKIRADPGPVTRFGNELGRYYKEDTAKIVASEIVSEKPKKILILTNCPSMITKFLKLDHPHIAAPTIFGIVFTRGFKKIILSLYGVKYDIVHINDNPKELRNGEYKNIFIP